MSHANTESRKHISQTPEEETVTGDERIHWRHFSRLIGTYF